MLFILDNTQKGVGVVQNFTDLYTEGLDSHFNFVEVECLPHKDLQTQNHIVYNNKLFVIKEVSESHSDTHMVEVYAESSEVSELLGHITRPEEFLGQTAEFLLTKVLAGTGWKVGRVEDVSTKDMNTSFETVLKTVLDIAELFELELDYRVEMDGLNIKGKYIDLVKEKGKRILKQFEYGINMSEVKRTRDSKSTINAIVGLGKEEITIQGANLSHLIPKGVKQEADFIYDEATLERQGHYVFGFLSSDAETKEQLLKDMLEQLKEDSEIRLTYECSVEFFSSQTGQRPNIGDTVIVRDLSFSTPLLVEARIQEIQSSISSPERDNIKLGNYKELDVNDFAALKEVQDLIKDNIDKWNKSGETIFKQDTSPSLPEVGNLWIDTSSKPEVMYRWDGVEWVSIGEPGLSQEEGQNIFDWLAQLEDRTDASNIVDSIVAEPSFEAILNGKANSADLDGLATGEQLAQQIGSVTQYIDGRTDENRDHINQVASDLERTAAELKLDFRSQGGTNLIYNSLGWVGFDFWAKTGVVSVLESDSLTRLGYGRGFTHAPNNLSAMLTQDIQIQPNEDYSISFWLSKPTPTGDVGVEIWEGTTRIDDAFIGKVGSSTTDGYELATYRFKSATGNIQIRLRWSNYSHGTITGLMLNRGQSALHWQHASDEIYNTNVKINLNGIQVKNESTGGYTVMSPQEFSGYAEVFNDAGQPEMEKIFTLNGETTEVKQLQAEELFRLDTIEIRSDSKGWTFVSSGR